jgi:DNA-binding SARP family transcriptional activator
LRKARGLLKLLALAPGHRLHREQLQDRLWPELGPAAAANNLKQVVYAARRALECTGAGAGAAVHLQGDLLALRPPRQGAPLQIDIDGFEAAAATARRTGHPAAYRQALGLYAGELLPEDRYEDWAASRREQLRALYLALLAEAAALHEAGGDRGAAIAALQRVLAADAAHEAAHAGLMRLYALAGRRSEALRQYHALREALKREFDAEPGAASRRLYQDLLAG